MTQEPSALNSNGEHPQQMALNMQHLRYSEAIELLQIGVKRYSELALLVSEAVSKADERARLESLKPPPAVDYMSLRSSFHRTLHSLDRLRPSQQFEHVWRLSSDLDSLVSQASASVNQNSTHKTVEEAFICLQKFASQIWHTDGKIYKGLTREDGCTLDAISEAMVNVGTLLKAKGGAKDAELKEKIEYWARGGETGCEDFSFPEVLRILWGTGEEKESDDKGMDEDDEEENAKKEVSHGVRSFAEIDNDDLIIQMLEKESAKRQRYSYQKAPRGYFQ